MTYDPNDPSGGAARFAALDIYDSPAEREAAERVRLDREREAAGVSSISVEGAPVNVAGIPGWYNGDTFHTTSNTGHSVDGISAPSEQSSDGILADDESGPSQRARRLFRMDFEYGLEPAGRFRPNGDIVKEDGCNWVVRLDTGARVGPGTVGRRYTILQPDTMDILDDVIGPDVVIDRGGSFKGGAVLWLQTRMQTIQTPSGPAQTRALVSNSYDRSAGFKLVMSCEVVSCRNVYKHILKSAENVITIRHTASAPDKLRRFREAFANAGEMFDKAQAEMMAWGRMDLSEDALEKFIRKVFPHDEDGKASSKTAGNIGRFRESINSSPGAQPETLWGLAQGITHYATHGINTRSGTDPVHSAYFGSGSNFAGQGFDWLRDHAQEEEKRAQQHVVIVPR